jgi:hypothetical protein
MVFNETKQINGTVYEIHRWDDEYHFFKKIIVTDPGLIKPIEYTEKVAKFSLGDFTEMLAYQGMQVEEIFGDYSFGSYDVSKTPRMIIVAWPHMVSFTRLKNINDFIVMAEGRMRLRDV